MATTANAILLSNAGSRLLVEGRYANALKMFVKSLKVLKLSKRSRSANLPISLDDCILESSSEQKDPMESSSFVCAEPIFVDEEEGNFLKLFATIVFNLALVHHLQGLRCRSTSALNKAATLYEMCLKVQIKNRFDLGEYYKLLVLPNNLGHVNMRLGRTKRAQGYMQFLSRQLATYGSGKSAVQETRPNLEGFFLNVSCLCVR